MIRQISKFFLLFIIIIFFINFKNNTKILKLEVLNVKSDYTKDLQLFLKRKILLTKNINLLRIDELDNEYIENKNVIKFDRDIFNDLTLIKVSYDKSE